MNSPVNARKLLLGPEPEGVSLTGKGFRVMFLDSGVPHGIEFGGRLRNLNSSSGWDDNSDHGTRVASICGEGPEATDLEEGPLGLAPGCEIVSALYAPLWPDQYREFFKEVTASIGGIHVLGIPWSAQENHWLAHDGRGQFNFIAEGSEPAVVVAAAGHDGNGRIRFPASSESVISVGVHEPDGSVSGFCGTQPTQRKPELMVPNLSYFARCPDVTLGRLSGTSAAVSIVCGLILLWCERLAQSGLPISPGILRAALLASSEPSAIDSSRIVHNSESLIGTAPFFALEVPARKERCYIQGRFRQTGKVAIAAFATGEVVRSARLWMPRRPVVRISTSASISCSAGLRWSLAELCGRPGDTFRAEIEVEGHCKSLSIAITGGSEILHGHVPLTRQSARRHFTVIGVSASHNGSACVVQDGIVQTAIQLERITRRKWDGVGYLSSALAIDYCLDAVGLAASEVDFFAFNAQPLLPGWSGLTQPCADSDFSTFDPFDSKALFVSHHLAHAFAAFSASPFSSATVLVCDGSGGAVAGADDLIINGDQLKEYLLRPLQARPALHVQSTYLFDRTSFRLVDREYAESFNVRCGSSSLGETYAAVSQYIFGDWRDGGKVMGLAPYGSADAAGTTFLYSDSQDRLQFRSDWKNLYCTATHKRSPMHYRHLAARIQKDLETALLQRVATAINKTGEKRLVYTGGLALNCAANEKIANIVDNFYVFPASNDAGIAVGAAAAAAYHATSRLPKPKVFFQEFSGFSYAEEDYRIAMRDYANCLDKKDLDLAEVAECLAKGEVVGWFEGSSEFGPRALGHRSIFGDARHKEIWTRINSSIKYREDFRPLAPCVPIECAERYFELEGASEYMLRTVRIRPQFQSQLAAVCHVDGTARVQTVDKQVLPRLHQLLQLVEGFTGVPVLVNTSLNVRGEPLIEKPIDAIEMLLSTALDVLVLGNMVLRPKSPRDAGCLGLQDAVCLAPKTELRLARSKEGSEARISSEYDWKVDYRIPLWLMELLSQADGRKMVSELIGGTALKSAEDSTVLPWLTALWKERYLLISRHQ